MGQDDNMIKDKVQNEAMGKVAETAATAIGGPVAGAAAKGLSKTKVGQAVLSKGAEKLGKNPMLAKQMNSRNKMGASNAPSSGSSGSAPASSGSAPKTSGNAPSSSMNLGDKLKGAGANALSSSVDSDSAAGQAMETVNDIKSLFGKGKKSAMLIKLCLPFVGYFFLILICAAAVIGFILGPADTVIQFFRDGWDSLKTLVGYKNDEYWELEYYKKLDEVQEDLNKKYGVCIDINLITATLTVDMGTDQYVREGQEIEVDTPDGSELGLTGVDYKKMIKQVELLGNMQIRRSVYGLDNQWKTTNPFTGEEIKYCSNPETEADQQEKLITTQEDIDRFALDKPILSRVINNWLSRFGYAADGIPVRISEPVRQVARNDLDGGIFTFFTKRANEERNIAYYLYRPPFEIKEYDDNGNKLQTPTVTCNEEPKSDPTGHDFAVLDVGELNDMENNVYYWNLMDSFIVDYYKDYLPSNGGSPFEPETENYEKVKKIVSDIYLLYHEMGPSRMCENNYSCVDIDISYDSSQLGDSALCPNGIEVVTNGKTELINFEDYVAGVVAHENNWHQGSSIENLKAAAVAARTYAIKRTNYCSSSISNSTNAQTYSATSDQYILQAVAETKGIMLTRGGKPISTEYDALAYKSEDDNYVTIKQNNQKIPLSWFDESGNGVCNNNLNAARNGKLAMHGRGMSQCGSRYLDSIGYTYDQILSYYYGNEVALTLTEELDPALMEKINNSQYTGFAQICDPSITGTSPRGNFTALSSTGGKCMDLSESYWNSDNAYKGNLKGQCTWYAYGRSLKALVEDSGMSMSEAKSFLNENFLYRNNNGGEWYKNGSEKGLKSSPNVDDIQPGSIISWAGGQQGWGHVGFVEAVERVGGKVVSVTVSERNDAGCTYGQNNATIRTYTAEQIKTAGNKKMTGTVVIVDGAS